MAKHSGYLTFRKAWEKPMSWWRQQSRKYILKALAWNDRNGSYLDEDLEEGMERCLGVDNVEEGSKG